MHFKSFQTDFPSSFYLYDMKHEVAKWTEMQRTVKDR